MAAKTPHAILVVDDHPAVLLGLRYAIQAEWPHCEVHGVRSGAAAINAIQTLTPDVIMLDYQMPGMNGYETARRLLQLNATLPILLFTFLDSLVVAVNFLAIGGKGFITKGADLPTMIEAIEKLMAGEYYFHSQHDQELSALVLQGVRRNLPAIQFTRRELEICLKLSKGLTASGIADQLNLSKRTVESYKETLMTKTGVKTTAELMAFIYQNGVNTSWTDEDSR